MRVMQPYKLASRDFSASDTVIDVGGVPIGRQAHRRDGRAVQRGEPGDDPGDAHMVKAAGATILRGGAFKPRSSPYSFQGLGEEGLKYLAEAREQTGCPSSPK
jgi:3-deoxy-7-phosphoheptulonate synthase